MNRLAISHSVEPNGCVIKYLFGMEKPVSNRFLFNTVREGGINHIEGQEAALKEFKRILKLEA